MYDITEAAQIATGIASDLRERAGDCQKTRARDHREMARTLDDFAAHLRQDGIRDGHISLSARQALARAAHYFQAGNPAASAEDIRRVGNLARPFTR